MVRVKRETGANPVRSRRCNKKVPCDTTVSGPQRLLRFRVSVSETSRSFEKRCEEEMGRCRGR